MKTTIKVEGGKLYWVKDWPEIPFSEYCFSFSKKYPCDGNNENAKGKGYCTCWEHYELEQQALSAAVEIAPEDQAKVRILLPADEWQRGPFNPNYNPDKITTIEAEGRFEVKEDYTPTVPSYEIEMGRVPMGSTIATFKQLAYWIPDEGKKSKPEFFEPVNDDQWKWYLKGLKDGSESERKRKPQEPAQEISKLEGIIKEQGRLAEIMSNDLQEKAKRIEQLEAYLKYLPF